MPSPCDNKNLAADRPVFPSADKCRLPAAREADALEGCTFDLVNILSSVQETAYLWDIVSDRIEWAKNAAHVLGVGSTSDLATAANFHFLIAPEYIRRRLDAIARASSPETDRGAHYRVEYLFSPRGRRGDTSLWLEDHGQAWFDNDGRPIRARGIIRVINERHLEEQRLLYRSDHDALTGQLNRFRLTDALDAALARAERTKQPSAFLMAAVNNLAVINETFGFAVGDDVIGAVARVIRSRLRSGDTIGRYSSNKFGIILNDCGPGSMRIAAERFIKAVRDATIETTACPLSSSIAIGAVLLPDYATSAHQAVSHALQALNQAKQGRSETYAAFEPSAARDSTRKRNITIAEEVITALNENRMLIALQPIVSTKTGQPDLYECLLRMKRPDGTLVSAGDFIAVAEQLGLSRLIDRRTLELSVEVLLKHPDIRLSVNVSSLTAGDHEWLVLLHRLTGGRRTLTERLTIEITETSAIDDLDLTINFVDTLKELGCRVAIDDFGAGYTSFKNLKILNVDMVKIDGSFVTNLLEEPPNRVFIKSLVEIAQAFGLDTVAEWVADEETARICAECRITHMQGFLFGRPQTEREFRQKRASGAEAC